MQEFYNQNNFPGMNFNNMNEDANLNMENNTCKCNNMNNNMNNNM